MSSLPYDLLAIDLDGTLLDNLGALPGRNREALHRAHASGMKIVLCTGRCLAETRSVVDEIGLDLDACVTCSGAVLTELATQRTLSAETIGPPLALEASGWFAERDYTVLWLTQPEPDGSEGYVLPGANRHPAIDVWLARAPFRMRENGPPHPQTDPLRLTIIDRAPTLAPVAVELEAAFGERLTHNLMPARRGDFAVIEVFRAGVDKWSGILKLCRRWSIDPRRTAAIGDEVNDLPMIRGAGLGVAMGNAAPPVRAAAKRHVADNQACGVAELIDALLG